MAAVIRTSVLKLFVHGDRGSRPTDTDPTPMLSLTRVGVVAGFGIKQDSRFFRPPDPGRERLRQVSLIDEGTLRRHEAKFGSIDWSHVKSQIVLAGDVCLPEMTGAALSFEDGPEMILSIARVPCYAMDLVVPGLKVAMENGAQGSMARVVRDGEIWVGQQIQVRVAEAITEFV